MPRSSVYVRLQWPAEGAAEESGATSSHPQDTAQSPLPNSTQKILQPQLSTQKTIQPQLGTQEAPQIKKESSVDEGNVHHSSSQPSEKRQEHKSGHKCSVCPAKSPSSPHLPALPHPAGSTTVVSLPASTSVTSAAITTTMTTTTTTAATKHGRHPEAAPGTQARVKVKVRDTPRDKLRRNLTERIPRTIQAGDEGTGTRHSRTPHLDTSHSLDSPLWHKREQARTDTEGEQQDVAQESTNKLGGARTYYKSKARLRPRNPNAKGRRITRSLSASCVSVSTNTDPKDFLELAKLSATLPSKKEKEAHTTKSKDSSDDVKPQIQERTEEADGSDSRIADSKEHSTAEIVSQITQLPHVEEVGEIKEEMEEESEEIKSGKLKGTTGEVKGTTEVMLEEDITEMSDTRCAGDGCDDAGIGYIELPTYSPTHPFIDLQEKIHDNLSSYSGVPSCPSYPILPSGPPYPSFHAHTGPLPLPNSSHLTQVPVEGSIIPAEAQKFIVITPHLTCPPTSDLTEKVAPSSDCLPSSSPSLRVCPVSPSSSPSCDHSQTVSSCKSSPSRTFHLSSQDDADLITTPWPTTPSSGIHSVSMEALPSKITHQNIIPRSPSSHIIERCHWGDKNPSVYSSNRPPTPAVSRRHLEGDMALDSCPDVVLQTLEGEGVSGQNKTLKKSVTFLLPPDHWDSLISLRESSSMWVCGHPACITKGIMTPPPLC